MAIPFTRGTSLSNLNIAAQQQPLGEYSPETQAVLARQERRRQIANMLIQQGITPGPAYTQAGRFVVPQSWSQGLADLLKVGVGAYGLSRADKAGQEAIEKENKLYEQAIKGYKSRLGGTPAVQTQAGALGVSEDENAPPTMGTPTVPPTPEGRQAAILALMENRIPSVQRYGMQQQGVFDVGQAREDVQRERREMFEEQRKQRTFEMQQRLAQQRELTKDRLAMQRANQIVVIGPDGVPRVNEPFVEGRKDIAAAGAARTTLGVNTQLPASEEAQKDFMKSSRETYDQLKQVPATLQNIEKTKALIPGARNFMGPGGETLLQAAKFLNDRLGTQIDTKGVKSAEELRTRMFFQVMDLLKKVDAQPSQLQQLIMQRSFGNLGTDPNAMSDMLDAYAEVLRNKVGLYNTEVQGAGQRGVKFPYDPVIKLPEMGQGIPATGAATPPASGSVAPFNDAGKEKRYQEWRKQHK